jgi:hypothetical protein
VLRRKLGHKREKIRNRWLENEMLKRKVESKREERSSKWRMRIA